LFGELGPESFESNLSNKQKVLVCAWHLLHKSRALGANKCHKGKPNCRNQPDIEAAGVLLLLKKLAKSPAPSVSSSVVLPTPEWPSNFMVNLDIGLLPGTNWRMYSSRCRTYE